MRTRRPARPGTGAPKREPKPEYRRQRRDDARDLLFGRNAVREALRAGRRRFHRLWINLGSEPDRRLEEIRALAESRDVRVQAVERVELDKRVDGNHQGVVLEASAYPYVETYDLQELAASKSVALALDGIEDPQNLGTLLRTAEATGVALTIIPSDRAAQVTPTVVNASAGSVEHLRIAREVNLARWIDRAKAAGFWVCGLAGDSGAEPLFASSMRPPIVLVVGSEGHGMRRLTREKCDVLVSLPMVGRVESLNAAVAGSIGLYEILRDASED